MKFIVRNIPNALALFMAAIFIDSLRYKFTDDPKTQVIFGRLDEWAAGLGARGLFGHTGLFSQYVIGFGEIIASSLLLIGILPRLHHLQAMGAALGMAIMLGAVTFHLFTPLTTDPNQDGGGLFVAACLNLAFGILLVVWFRRREAMLVVSRIANVFAARRL